MIKKTAILMCALLGLACACVAAKDEIPQPSGWVNDFAGVISDDYRQKLTGLISDVDEKTSAEIAVVTAQSISPHDEIRYARLLFDMWKPGKKGKDNGVLVLLAVKERRWRIETGYGVEGILPDGLCGEIGRSHMVPYFKEGKYGEGLYNGVAAIASVIAKDAHVTLDTLSGKDMSVAPAGRRASDGFFLYAFLFIFFSVWNMPWPLYLGLPISILFAVSFFSVSPLAAAAILAGYIVSFIARINRWHKLPPNKRRNFFVYTPIGDIGWRTSGGWGGGGGFGGGGFGGGGGGGGGAGGGF